MRVVVTGSAGFIGSHIVESLSEAGHEVVGLDLREGSDVRDADAVAAVLRGAGAVCHQAAMVGLGTDIFDLPSYVSTNAWGTAVLLAGMARAKITDLVLASSMVVYGEGAYACPDHGPVRPEPRAERDLAAGRFEPGCPLCGAPLRPGVIEEAAALDPRNVYADTKVAQEHLAASWARATGGRVVALRYHNVYGPRMPRDTPYAGVAAIFRSALAHGWAPQVYEDGRQRRDFVHVRDVARANALAVERVGDRSGLRAYNVASGTPHTVGELASALAAACGGPEPVVTGRFRLGDVRHIVASPMRAERELGFRAQVGFTEGMAEFAAESAGQDGRHHGEAARA